MPMHKELIAKNIRQKRRERGWSQEYLAEKCDLSTQYISQIETKKKTASLKALFKIADAFGVSVESITGNTMKSNNPKNYEIDDIFDDLSNYERAVLKDVLLATKKALRENKEMDADRDLY